MTERENKEADEFQELIEAMGDYFNIVQLNSEKYLGIIINTVIPIKNGVALDTGLYMLDMDIPYPIYSIDIDSEDSNLKELKSIDNNTPMGLTFYQLIVDIYNNMQLDNSLRKLIRDRLINDLERNGQTQKILTTRETIRQTTKNFDIVLQGKATNILSKLSNKGKTTEYNKGTDEARIISGDLTLFLNKYSDITRDLSPTTYRLLDALISSFTNNGGNNISIKMPLSDYMEKCGLKDVKSARKQVKEELENLYNISIEWSEKIKSDNVDFMKTRICDQQGIKAGVIYFSLSQAFYNYLINTHIMPYPKQLYLINPKRNPHSFYFLRRISEHKNMNIGKSNENIIAVKTLLEASPIMPRYEELHEVGKIAERIIEPFERDMDNLSDTLNWEYCKKAGEPLKEKEIAIMTYDIFSNLMIKTLWKEYPERNPQKQNKKRG